MPRKQRRPQWTVALLALCLGLATPVRAEDAADLDFEDFGELDLAALLDAEVESASGAAQQISWAPAVIEVITPEQIRAWGASNLYEVLAHIAGVEIIENHWGRTTVNFRGIHTELWNNKVLLLIDNHPLYEVGNQSFFLEQVPINAVSRIEVIRGPGGVVFGTNAYAGVINVFTKTPEERGADGGIGVGALVTDDGRDGGDPLDTEVRLSGAMTWTDGYGQVDVQFWRTPLYRAIVPQASQSAQFRDRHVPNHTFPMQSTSTAVVGKLGQTVGKQRLRLIGGYHDMSKNKWGLVPTADSPSEPSDIRNAFAAAYWDTDLGPATIGARLGFDWNDQFNRAGVIGAAAFFPPARRNDPVEVVANTRKTEAALFGSTSLLQDDLTISGGLQGSAFQFEAYKLQFASDEALVPTVPALDYEPITWDLNAFTQVGYSLLDRVDFMAGARLNYFDPGDVRHDEPDPEATLTLNPRASIVGRLAENTTAKLLYGRAFRIPSLFELFVEAATIIYGDPSLVPETIDTVEAAIDTRPLEGWSLRLNAFYSRTDNDIELVPVPDGAEQYTNGSGRSIRGVELTSRVLVAEWLDIYATAGFQEAEARDTGHYLSEIARVLGSLSTSVYLLDRDLALTPTLRYIGPRDGLGGSTIWDATAYYDIIEQFGVGLVAKNVFDKRHADIEVIRQESPGGVIQNQPRTITAWLYGRF